MTGRRQQWTGITLFQSMLQLAFVLALLLSASMLALSRPAGSWEAATLVATAILMALCARRMVVVPRLSELAGSVAGPAKEAAPALFRLSPDAPGRPQPRAPGRDARARPA